MNFWSKPIAKRDFYAAFVFATVAFGILLAKFATSETAAAWVAAVGTVAAVWAAIWVGQRSVQEEKSRNFAHGRVVAFRLAPHIVTMLGDIERAREAIGYAREPHSAVMNRLIAIVQQMGTISSIPPDIFGETWTLPPAIALAVAQLESGLTVHMRLVENVTGIVIGLSPDHKEVTLISISASLDALERLAITVKKHCATISDDVVLEDRSRRAAELH